MKVINVGPPFRQPEGKHAGKDYESQKIYDASEVPEERIGTERHHWFRPIEEETLASNPAGGMFIETEPLEEEE